MNGRRSLSIIAIMLILPACVQPAGREHPAPAIMRDSFTDGRPELSWRPYPYFNQDNLKGGIDSSSPEGEPGVGVLDNGKAGGFAALSYAETRPVGNFHLEAWLHVQVTDNEKGSLNGIAFRVNPVTDRYYRFAAHFAAAPSLSLAYVGKDTNHFPVMLAEWQGATLPGGAPKRSGWHRVIIEVKDDSAEIFWDSSRLPGGPFHLERIAAGYIGVYATYTGGRGLAETRIDGLRIGP